MALKQNLKVFEKKPQLLSEDTVPVGHVTEGLVNLGAKKKTALVRVDDLVGEARDALSVLAYLVFVAVDAFGVVEGDAFSVWAELCLCWFKKLKFFAKSVLV